MTTFLLKGGSRFTGCYNTIEEIPLASVVHLNFDIGSTCKSTPASGEMFAAGLCIEYSENSQSKDSQFSFCIDEEVIIQALFYDKPICGDLSTAVNNSIIAGCEDRSIGRILRVCTGEFGHTPKPPKGGGPVSISSSSRLCPFGWC